jgi:TldD protein
MRFSKNVAIDILNEGLSTGADYAEIYFQDDRTHGYSRRFKKVYSVSSSRTCGVGIRLMQGTKQVYGYTSDLSKASLMELARNLSYGFDSERVLTVTTLKEKKKKKTTNPVKIPHSAWDVNKKLAYLEEGEKASYAVSDKVKNVTVSLMEDDEHVEVYNSDGIIIQDDRVRTRLTSSVVATDGKQFQDGYEEPGLSKGLELLEEIDFPALCRESAKSAVELLSAPEGPSGEMPVVLGNQFGGVLFHEACGHPLEGSAISRGESPFAGKLGQKIASDVVNAYDDGTIENGWGSENFDDEGNEPTKNQLIKDGVLVSYMLDRYTARRIDPTLKATGACRREGYRYLPTTRMTNTYIGGGKSTPEEIIAHVKNGIYCKGFTGGQVDPSTDQFIFTSDIAYVIKDGKLSHMIKPVSLVGYGYEILSRIEMVGNDEARAPGVCGASSGSCYVEVGQPTLLISKMLVGGSGGNE